MRHMLSTIGTRLRQGQALTLVTVTAATGAAPRGAGARMLVGQEGRICGTIGGGAVEYRSIQIAQTVLQEKSSREHDFSLTRDDVQKLGMICGGAVNVFFHYLSPGDPDVISLADEAERRFAEGDDLWLVSEIGVGGTLSLYSKKGGVWGKALPNELIAALSAKPQRMTCGGREFYTEQICSAGRVYIFGGGHVAQELEPVLSHVGFRCVVMDDREEFADPALFPTAEEVRLVDFSRLSDFVTIGSRDYVCIMTRGHASDTVIQAQILPLKPCYVGVIGSRKKAASVRQTLREDYGLTDELLDQVITPIGLEIQADTPAEIAISIAAQMIAIRAKKRRE